MPCQATASITPRLCKAFATFVADLLRVDHFLPAVGSNRLPMVPVDFVANELHVAIAKRNIHSARVIATCGCVFVHPGKALIRSWGAGHSKFRFMFAPSIPDGVASARIGTEEMSVG